MGVFTIDENLPILRNRGHKDTRNRGITERSIKTCHYKGVYEQ